MIKEIVDIGRVSNKLGSVFTFKGLPEFYVEVILEWDGEKFKFIPKSKPEEISDKELYLDFGLFRGKSGSNIFILPSSFILNLTCDYAKTKQLQKKLEEQKDAKEQKKIDKQYKSEFKKFREDKDSFEKQIQSGVNILQKFFEAYKKEQLNSCKNSIIAILKTKEYKTKKEKAEYKKILTSKCQEKYKKEKSSRLLDFLQNISKTLLENIDEIIEMADGCKKYIHAQDNNKKIENIPIVLKLKNGKNKKEYFPYTKYSIFNIYEKIIFDNSAQKLMTNKEHQKGICNIYSQDEKNQLFFPKSAFYYPCSLDKVNVYPNLNTQEISNIFNLSQKAYLDFLIGRTYLETYNSFYFMKLNCYITSTSLNDTALKKFQNDVKKSKSKSKSNLDGLIDLIDENSSNRFDTLLNFYFFEPTKTGNNIIEYIKDIIPSQLVQIAKLSKSLTELYQKKFNRDKFQFSWQQHIFNIYNKDEHKKFRTSLFRQIALGSKISLDRLILIMNENMQYSISKKEDSKDKYYYGTVIKHLLFLNWLDKINKGEINRMSPDEQKKEFFEGKTYEERLSYFLSNGNLVKESASMKVGVCMGLALNILSWSINGYDKKTLAFVGKRIERNSLSSVQAFMNEIFAKTKFHEYEGLQSINIRLATKELLNLDNSSFNKDEFIFGLFLGSELYRNVKSEKDPEPQNNEEETTENEESNTGE
jgi:CRISPR-associated protein Cas8b/Csh1 subtype I-B